MGGAWVRRRASEWARVEGWHVLGAAHSRAAGRGSAAAAAAARLTGSWLLGLGCLPGLPAPTMASSGIERYLAAGGSPGSAPPAAPSAPCSPFALQGWGHVRVRGPGRRTAAPAAAHAAGAYATRAAFRHGASPWPAMCTPCSVGKETGGPRPNAKLDIPAYAASTAAMTLPAGAMLRGPAEWGPPKPASAAKEKANWLAGGASYPRTLAIPLCTRLPRNQAPKKEERQERMLRHRASPAPGSR